MQDSRRHNHEDIDDRRTLRRGPLYHGLAVLPIATSSQKVEKGYER